MSTTADQAMAKWLEHLRDKIEYAIVQSEKNCLSDTDWRPQHGLVSTSELKKVIAADILSRFADQIFRAPSAAAAEFVDGCHEANCKPFPRHEFDDVLRHFFHVVAEETGANDVLRLSA